MKNYWLREKLEKIEGEFDLKIDLSEDIDLKCADLVVSNCGAWGSSIYSKQLGWSICLLNSEAEQILLDYLLKKYVAKCV